MYGMHAEIPEPLDATRWQASRAYLYGMDLFNHGYYWEAHEAWEGLWHRAGRQGMVADFLKGLIKLAAAGVKHREGIPRGVAGHAAGAAELFRQTGALLSGADPLFAGLRLADLLAFAAQAECLAPSAGDKEEGLRIVFSFLLEPSPAVMP
jgi:hypothetical protein